FSEIHLGPKYTFLRNECTQTLGAVGLTFEIPAGPSKVFQDTGNLSLTPYVTLGQNFLKSSYGSFNALGTFGDSFPVDNRRTDFFFNSYHLDYDIANAHKFYPLVELNWFHYTRNGGARDIDFEGKDLFNFGAEHVAGHNDLSIAVGARYKFSEAFQLGA